MAIKAFTYKVTAQKKEERRYLLRKLQEVQASVRHGASKTLEYRGKRSCAVAHAKAEHTKRKVVAYKMATKDQFDKLRNAPGMDADLLTCLIDVVKFAK